MTYSTYMEKLTQTTAGAFAEFAAARGHQHRLPTFEAPVAQHARPLTEGEKVNLNIDATLGFSGGIALGLLAAPLAILCPPVGIGLAAAAAGSTAQAINDTAKLARN